MSRGCHGFYFRFFESLFALFSVFATDDTVDGVNQNIEFLLGRGVGFGLNFA